MYNFKVVDKGSAKDTAIEIKVWLEYNGRTLKLFGEAKDGIKHVMMEINRDGTYSRQRSFFGLSKLDYDSCDQQFPNEFYNRDKSITQKLLSFGLSDKSFIVCEDKVYINNPLIDNLLSNKP